MNFRGALSFNQGERRWRHALYQSCTIARLARRMRELGTSACNRQKEVIVKSVIYAVVATSAFAVSVPAFAQSDTQAPLTRAQVRAELQQLEQAGYSPSTGEDINYPQDIQAAEARVAARNGATGYGGAKSTSSAAGSPTVVPPTSP